MYLICNTRRNLLGYVIWRWILRNKGAFVSYLDAHFLGPDRGMNDYGALASGYSASNVKPDKQFSILPTVLEMVGDCQNKTVLDLGCGAGFFTVPFAEQGASLVYGIDNASAQIELAKKIASHPRVRYFKRDIFVDKLPEVDIAVAPFVLNYARTAPILRHFFKLLHASLHYGGKAVLVVDLPNGKNLKRFGAKKSFEGPVRDETGIRIELFNGDAKICTLSAVYYTAETISRLLLETGFQEVHWCQPIISEEGIGLMEPGFWEGYTANPELGYLTAIK